MEKVDELVMVDNHDGRSCITVRGHLHARVRQKTLFLVRDVRIEIIPNTHQQQEVWMKRMRALIAPWNLLGEQVRKVASRGLSSGVDEFEIALGGLATCMVGTKPSSASTDKGSGHNLVHFAEKMGKLSIVDEPIAHGIAAVESGTPYSINKVGGQCGAWG